MISVNPSSLGRLIAAWRRYPGGTEKLSIFLTLSREIPKCSAAARALMPSAQAKRRAPFPVKFHGENTPALPGVRKGKSGRLLRRPQPDHPAATVDEFCTAVLITAPALGQTIAVAVHLEDVDVMGQAVQKRAGQTL